LGLWTLELVSVQAYSTGHFDTAGKLVSRLLRATHRGGRWFESTAAHHGFRNANRGREKTEGRDDAVAALDSDLNDQVVEQRLSLTGRSAELRGQNIQVMEREPSASPPSSIVLTPRPKQLGFGLVIFGLLAMGCLWLALSLYGVRDFKGVGVFLAAAVGIPLAIFLYMRNAQLFANADFIGKRNLLGLSTRCSRDEFDSIGPGRGTSPQLWFYRKDGGVAFKVQSALWANDQVKALTDFLGHAEIGRQTYLDALRRRPPQ
jgi:hypothetical protein